MQAFQAIIIRIIRRMGQGAADRLPGRLTRYQVSSIIFYLFLCSFLFIPFIKFVLPSLPPSCYSQQQFQFRSRITKQALLSPPHYGVCTAFLSRQVLYSPFFPRRIMPTHAALDAQLGPFLSESFFSPIFRHFFRANFQSSISSCFFSKYWYVNELVFFCSGEFHEQ